LKRNHLWDFGYVIVDEDGNILHYLGKDKYNKLIELDGEELKLTKLTWQHLEVSGSDRKVFKSDKLYILNNLL
jgi:hypothetical protein